MEVPKIPPRPKRGMERSVSPSGDRYAPSPLNDPTYVPGGPPKESKRLSTELPSRPPSVSIPSLGEEGAEYASFEDLSKTLQNDSQAGSPQHMKNVAGDLPLYAPTAEVPSSTAKSRIQAVTRTDSQTATAAGFGSQLSVDDKVSQSKSGNSGSSISSRPSSIYNEQDEHGIPEIGVQVPMFRNAGDVQAPSPAPFAQQAASQGIGFHQKPSGRHHGRTKSGREIFNGPPGSYGLHGHGKISTDEFEQKWYEKHPDDLKREKAGEYGPHIQENRKEYHWRADNLERLVHTTSQDIGMGTSRDAIGTPDEQIGYRATEEYASRMASPRPSSSANPASNKTGYVDSPLRNEAGQEINDKGEVIHIDPPSHRSSKVGGGYDPPTENLGPRGGNTADEAGWVTERGYGTPILASDELKKHPDSEWRQPAVSPEVERHADEYFSREDSVTKPRSSSRSSSRNNQKQQRVIPSPSQYDHSSTPLESHKEYEPLFPEDDDAKKPNPKVEDLKRPSVARHHFPSQDVWEDTPGSLQLETTVDTPQEPEEPKTAGGKDVSPAKIFEKPETEEQRKQKLNEEDQKSFLSDHNKQFGVENKLLGKVRDETAGRPGMQQRFPSQDIWEDAPSHGHLETTVSTPQMEETNEYAEDSPIEPKPTMPARPNMSARPAKKELSDEEKQTPIIPPRPARQTRASAGSPEKTPPTEARANESDASQHKGKPLMAGRPAGSKISALQASFLKDLNNKIGLGPPAPPKVKEPEPEEETEPAPLPDARKSRAKGPQRRKPSSSPTPGSAAAAAAPPQKLSIASVTAIWSFVEDGTLDVPAAKMAAQMQNTLTVPAKAEELVATEVVAAKSVSSGSEEQQPTPASSEDAKPVADAKTEKAEKAEKTEKTAKAEKTEKTEKTSLPEQIASQAANTLEPVTSKVTSALKSEEPLVTETAPGSFDAPGAFPGSGPDLENKGDVKTTTSDKKPADNVATTTASVEEKRDGSSAA
ncbi:uncharacterized protein SETTUDRAFT_165263 [Exserohilum turcica Et28A]|uniref:Altered inheritance of mitochondria protein 21 n=1 Tax=Exserohilum turcicum (strain 28A) TaxID=671987 RepID=R0JNU6_EXST2|nr:uncharacterized protein SETTUDRAFT_165263 [Exserohilum turcica Et28A]EOA82883.1 hypothetical protein SETTUDRAFT_165263 [Exserohilum turcica Et28A]